LVEQGPDLLAFNPVIAVYLSDEQLAVAEDC